MSHSEFPNPNCCSGRLSSAYLRALKWDVVGNVSHFLDSISHRTTPFPCGPPGDRLVVGVGDAASIVSQIRSHDCRDRRSPALVNRWSDVATARMLALVSGGSAPPPRKGVSTCAWRWWWAGEIRLPPVIRGRLGAQRARPHDLIRFQAENRPMPIEA